MKVSLTMRLHTKNHCLNISVLELKKIRLQFIFNNADFVFVIVFMQIIGTKIGTCKCVTLFSTVQY